MGRGGRKSGSASAKASPAKSRIGGNRAKSSGTSGQIRLDELLKPRRSARNASLLQSGKEIKDEKEQEIIYVRGREETVQTRQGETKKIESTAEVRDGEASKSSLPCGNLKKKAASGRGVNKTQNKEKKKEVKLSDEEKHSLLRSFDLNSMYGPCRGISRRMRFLRAIRFQLQPPPEALILEILDSHANEGIFQSSIWDQHEMLKPFD